MIATEFGVLIDSVVEPQAAFTSLRLKRRWLASLFALTFLVFAGAIVQAPVTARGNADQLQKAFASGQMSSFSQEKRDAMVRHALTRRCRKSW